MSCRPPSTESGNNSPVAGKSKHESTGSSASTFEFLGTPRYPGVFTSGAYFSIIGDTLNGALALAARDPTADPANDASFIAAFEGYGTPPGAPYMDHATPTRYPTIGIGLNLTTLSGSGQEALATDVKNYYEANYPSIDISSLTPSQVVTMLEDQARTGSARVPGVHAPIRRQPALTIADAQALLQSLLQEQYEPEATAAVGNTLTATEFVTLVDLAYNNKVPKGASFPFPGVAAALNATSGPDNVLAGFNLVDAKRTLLAGNRGLFLRTEAEYQNLFLQSDPAELGNFIS